MNEKEKALTPEEADRLLDEALKGGHRQLIVPPDHALSLQATRQLKPCKDEAFSLHDDGTAWASGSGDGTGLE